MSSRQRSFGSSLVAASALTLAGCMLEVVDLRPTGADELPLVCGESERTNPETGSCEPCTVRSGPPATACLCAHSYHPSPFPYCEGEQADFDCLPCEGSIDDCNAYDVDSGEVSSCSSLRECCSELEAAGSPCCPQGESVYCPELGGGDALGFDCCRCLGTLCSAGCEAWQSCDTTQTPARCTPACKPTGTDAEYCCIDCGCTCQPQPQ